MKITKTPVETVGKVWGSEQWLVNNESYCMKLLVLHVGFTSSWHYHRAKKETLVVKKGSCHLVMENRDGDLECQELVAGDSVTIYPGRRHRIFNPEPSTRPCVIYEVSTRHYDYDVVRETESKKI